MKVLYEGSMCWDCTEYLANGDIPEERPTLPEEIQLQWPDTSLHLINGDSEKDEEFSWSACDCCGSSLGGARTAFVVLQEEGKS